MAKQGEHAYSFANFCALLYQWSIKPTKWDKYACPLCFLLYHYGKSIDEIENDWHSVEKDVVWALYRTDVDFIRAAECHFVLIIMDYCRVRELGHISMDTDEDRSKLSILNFTVVLAGNKEYHYDFFANGKQGPKFMEAVMTNLAPKLRDLVKGKRIHLWSDGGLRTYGTVSNVALLASLLEVEILQTFFPRYHGHSRCDAHFGRGKMELRKHFPVGGLDNVVQVLSAFTSLGNTFAETITFDNERKNGRWDPQWGVKSAQQLHYNAGLLLVKSLPHLYVRLPTEGWEKVELPKWKETKRKAAPSAPTPQASSSTPAPKRVFKAELDTFDVRFLPPDPYDQAQ